MYYNNDKPLLTDEQYDILFDFVSKKYPNEIEIGSSVSSKKKVDLPFYMPSMNKIKDDKQFLLWKQKHNNDTFVVSVKLDGVSALFDSRNDNLSLYSRGDGKVGCDISHLIPYIDMSDVKDVVFRGELIISKECDETKRRNVVSGLVNSKDLDTKKISMVDFVIYEVIYPVMKPVDQFSFLKQNYPMLKIVPHNVISSIELSVNILSEHLVRWRKECKYEMDGVICCENKLYERSYENPKHCFAFKMILSDQKAETTVTNVHWNISKDGYIIPRVQFESVYLNDVKIEYATGFNAKFIQDYKIGIGTVIEIVRSGDVIPHILSVIKPTESKFPTDVDYKWDSNNVHIVVSDSSSSIVHRKQVIYFYEGLKIEGFGTRTIERVYDLGYDTISKIRYMTMNDLLQVDGIQSVMANKIFCGINDKMTTTKIEKIISLSNILGRGFGEKKIKMILEHCPDWWNEKNLEKICMIKGMTEKSAQLFIDNISDICNFLKTLNIEYIQQNEMKQSSQELSGKIFVFSGFRSPSLETEIERQGGVVSSTITKETSYLVCKDVSKETTKTKKAYSLNIKIITEEYLKSIL